MSFRKCSPILFLPFLALLIANTLSGQQTSAPATTLRPGRPAPAISFTSSLQAPQAPQIVLKNLLGKPVVLEFWATWCGPCVAQIPHLNTLADSFAGKVQFISIDDEEPRVVEKFLKTHAMHSWLAFDPVQVVFKRYGIASRPTTVVIDRQGKILKVGFPEDVTPQLLANALREKAPPAEAEAPKTAAPAASPSLFELSITTALPNEHFIMASDNGLVEIHNANPLKIIGLIYGAHSSQMMVNAQLPDQGYDVMLKAPGTKEGSLLETVQLAFNPLLHLRPHWEDKEREVYVLTVDSTAATHLTSSTTPHGGYMMFRDGRLEAVKVSLGNLAAQLGDILGVPVVDQTELSGSYDVTLAVGNGSKEEVSAAVAALGLRLEKERKIVRTLIVDSEAKDDAGN